LGKKGYIAEGEGELYVSTKGCETKKETGKGGSTLRNRGGDQKAFPKWGKNSLPIALKGKGGTIELQAAKRKGGDVTTFSWIEER